VGRKLVKNKGGRPGKHGSRALQRLMNKNALDQRTATARMLRQIRADLAEDAGGEAALTGREKALLDRTSALLLICSSIEAWTFKQQDLLTKDGTLPAVLTNNYLSFVNTARLNLIALGLKPAKPNSEPDLHSYIKQKEAEEATE
jgi:hypothetical protein